MGSYHLVLIVCLVVFAVAQCERFPEGDLTTMPLATAYGRGLDHYAAENWTESINYMELSLRLHRHLRDSVRHCVQHCNRTRYGDEEEPKFEEENGDLRVSWLVIMRASCLKKCRGHFPVLSLPSPRRHVMEDFERRAPYRYLHFAYSKLNNLQRAVPCAHTYLQKNPDDQELNRLMQEYKTQYNLDGYLIDHEQRPYESTFLKAVGLVSSGEFSSSIGVLEKALQQYLQEYELCQAACKETSQLSSVQDLHPVLADVYIEALNCRVQCEDNLMPNVGGHFVDKFPAIIYHYLQYAFYKLNDGRSAVSSASSYLLFDPADVVMKQNLQFYQSYGQDWGLEPKHFTPRTEALRHHNQTETLRKMLAFTENFLQMDDKDFIDPEETPRTESSDVEFEGVGDYEESMVAKWWQPNGKCDSGDTKPV